MQQTSTRSTPSLRRVDDWVRDALALGSLSAPDSFARRAVMLLTRPRPPRKELALAEEHARDGTALPSWAMALLESVALAEQLIAHFQGMVAADLAELAGSYPGLREHLATEIGVTLGCSESWADHQLTEAESLHRRLPETAMARLSGRLSSRKVSVIVAETTVLAPDVAGHVESAVLPDAPRQTVPELRHAIRRAIVRLDPDGAKSRHQAAAKGRRVAVWSLPDGMAALQVTSTAPDIATIREAISAVGDRARVPGDERSASQRHVDALVDVCAEVLEAGSFRGNALPKQQSRRPHIQVTMSFDALLGADDVPCELSGYGPITPDQARLIAADGELRRLVCDPVTGTLLDYGRQRYRPPLHLANHVLSRDQCCRAPGCRQPSWRCEMDHVVPYPRGSTSVDNLVTLCKHHHRAKDGGGHAVWLESDGGLTWVTPLGKVGHSPAIRLVPRAPAAKVAGAPDVAARIAQAGDADAPPF